MRISRRLLAGLTTASLALSVTSCGGGSDSTISYDDEITVGILHSLSGTMAISEKPLYFSEIAELFSDDGFQAVARALGAIHETEELWQDKVGKFCLVGSEFAAQPPKGRG